MPGRVSGKVLISHDENLSAEPSWTKSKLGVAIKCAAGHLAYLSEKHDVKHDGKIEPSLVCPMEGCGWHVHATLDRWEDHGGA